MTWLLFWGCVSKEAGDSQPPAPPLDSPLQPADSSAETPGTDSPEPAESGGQDSERCPEIPSAQPELERPISLPGEGLTEEELRAGSPWIEAVLEAEGLAGVVWREQGSERYVVRTPEGEQAFQRSRDESGAWSWAWEGEAPWGEDPLFAASLEAQLAAGSNPEGSSHPDQGYELKDERLSFIELEEAHYPYSMRRLSALFDSPDAPDLGVVLAPYARGGVGSHGGLSAQQSRAPLLLRGPGVIPGGHALAAEVVDLAPTVAALLGVQAIEGIDGRLGVEASELMLRWQDGRVLEELLQPCAYGAAERAVVVILDGLSHTELLHQLSLGALPGLAQLLDGGAWLEGGLTVGWPSFSLPGHLSVHTGAWPGHHGLLSNSFPDRSEEGESLPGVGLSEALASPELSAQLNALISPEVETLFEAVGRSFPGERLAAINELTIRGANWSPQLLAEEGPPPATLIYELADAAALASAQQLLESEGPPKYLALSLYLSDAAGERYGPHGDATREALEQLDGGLQQLLTLYADAGALEDTLFVLTADHGMELQDPQRVSDWGSRAGSSGVDYRSWGSLVVLD